MENTYISESYAESLSVVSYAFVLVRTPVEVLIESHIIDSRSLVHGNKRSSWYSWDIAHCSGILFGRHVECY